MYTRYGKGAIPPGYEVNGPGMPRPGMMPPQGVPNMPPQGIPPQMQPQLMAQSSPMSAQGLVGPRQIDPRLLALLQQQGR